MQHAEQRWSGSGQATEAPVAPAQDAHPHQAALQLGHGALPVPQQDAREAATRPEEDPHVLALLAQTVIRSNALLAFSRKLKVPDYAEHLRSGMGMNGKILQSLSQTTQTAEMNGELMTNNAVNAV